MWIDSTADVDDLLSRYRAALDRLESWGIPIPDACRLRAYEKRWARYIDGTTGPLEVEAEDAFQMSFDQCEIDEIITIVEGFDRDPKASEFERLRKLPKGSENREDATTTEARDAQYELYIRSMLVQIDPYVRMNEKGPDLTAPLKNYIVEAKRPTNAGAVEGLVRKGYRQIDDGGEPGFLAVCFDDFAIPNDSILRAPTRGAIPGAARAFFREKYGEQTQMFVARAQEKPNVVAVWATFRISASPEDTNMLCLHTENTLISVAPRHLDLYRQFFGETHQMQT